MVTTIKAWLMTPVPPRPRRRWKILLSLALDTTGTQLRNNRIRSLEKRIAELEARR